MSHPTLGGGPINNPPAAADDVTNREVPGMQVYREAIESDMAQRAMLIRMAHEGNAAAPQYVSHDNGVPRAITQADLQRLKDLRYWKQELEECEGELRTRLVRLSDAGSPVEPGPRMIEVRRTEYRKITATSLTPLLGAEGVAELKERVAPVEITAVYIHERREPPAWSPAGAGRLAGQ
ncbi:MAG: hypothetical protein K8T91_14450 [Planctomycetes bacterium]|nr:hypothetical protein [Planctomycetota bacterium]